MRTHTSIAASLICTAVICSTACAGPKVVGTCKVQIEGPYPLTFTGQLYEGRIPEGTYASVANTRALGAEAGRRLTRSWF